MLRIELDEGNIEVLDELLRIKDFITGGISPKNFNPFDPHNDLLKHEKDFEGLVSSLEEAGIHGVKSMTVFEFYSRMEYFEKKNSKNK